MEAVSVSLVHTSLPWLMKCLLGFLINWPVHSFTVTPSKSQNTHWPSRTLPLPCRCLHGSEASVKFYYNQLHFTHSPVKMMLWGHAQKSFPSLHLHWKNIYSCKWYVSLWNQILKSWRKLKIRQMIDCGHFSSSLPSSWECANRSQGQAGATGALILQRPVARVGGVMLWS